MSRVTAFAPPAARSPASEPARAAIPAAAIVSARATVERDAAFRQARREERRGCRGRGVGQERSAGRREILAIGEFMLRVSNGIVEAPSRVVTDYWLARLIRH